MTNIYGIDLGTTNSLVSLDGKIITELIPSIVSLENKRAGRQFKEDLNALRSFKVDMTIHEEGKMSIISSGLVLKELQRAALEKGHKVEKAVISVPAYFSEHQRAATMKSAELAKIEVVRLINEPTAAAIAIAKEYKGLFVIYDLGGGTFDISIIDSRFGVFDVIANDGGCIAGDNIDAGIVDYLITAVAFRLHMFDKHHEPGLRLMAEKAKLHISQTREPYVFDFAEYPISDKSVAGKSNETTFTFTPGMYERIVRSVLRPTAMRTKTLVERHIDGEEYRLALVGGSTRCPYVSKYIEETLNMEAEELFYNPDTIVAEGASIYAKMVATGEDLVLVQDITKAIGILDADGTVRNIIPPQSKIPINRSTICSTTEAASGLQVEIYQGDSILAQNNEHLGSLVYDLSRHYSAGELSATIAVEVTIDGLVNVTVKEPLQKAKSVSIRRNDIKGHE